MKKLKIAVLALLFASASQAALHEVAVATVEPVTRLSRVEIGSRVEFRDLNSDCRFYGNVRMIGDTYLGGGRGPNRANNGGVVGPGAPGSGGSGWRTNASGTGTPGNAGAVIILEFS